MYVYKSSGRSCAIVSKIIKKWKQKETLEKMYENVKKKTLVCNDKHFYYKVR